MAKTFRELIVWQKAFDLVLEIYRITTSFPTCERYGLTAQMKRSAISIPSNIAEGFRRIHNKEYKQFLYIGLGSAAELETQIRLSRKLFLMEEKDEIETLKNLNSICGMLTNLIKKL